MSDKDLHLSSDIVMFISGFFFGFGFGMIAGYLFL